MHLTPPRSGRAPLKSDGQISSCTWLLLLLPAMLLLRARACRQGLQAARHFPTPCDNFQLLSSPLRISLIISVLHQRFMVCVQTLRSAGCSPAAFQFSLWLGYSPLLTKTAPARLLHCTNDCPTLDAISLFQRVCHMWRLLLGPAHNLRNAGTIPLSTLFFILFAPISRRRPHFIDSPHHAVLLRACHHRMLCTFNCPSGNPAMHTCAM